MALIDVPWAGAIAVSKQCCDNACLHAQPKLPQHCFKLVTAPIAVPWAGATAVSKQCCDNACLHAQPILSQLVQRQSQLSIQPRMPSLTKNQNSSGQASVTQVLWLRCAGGHSVQHQPCHDHDLGAPGGSSRHPLLPL